MEREWVTRERLMEWIRERLSRLEDCGECDNPSQREPIGLHRLKQGNGNGLNWAAESHHYLCYHQCRPSRDRVIEEASSRFNVKWE